MAASSMISINPHLYSAMPYDPRKELAGIVLVGAAPMGGSTADYRKLYEEEYARWAAVVKASGAKID